MNQDTLKQIEIDAENYASSITHSSELGIKLVEAYIAGRTASLDRWIEIFKEIEVAYKDSFKAKDEVDLDAESHPHFYKDMDYERKFDAKQFGENVEAIFWEDILPIIQPEPPQVIN